MDVLAALLDDALAQGLGSAVALSVGDAGVEVGRLLRGRVRADDLVARDATRGGVNGPAQPVEGERPLQYARDATHGGGNGPAQPVEREPPLPYARDATRGGVNGPAQPVEGERPLPYARDATRGGVNGPAQPVLRGRERPLSIDEATPFDLASLTKPMSTAALAMVLVGDGRLSLDAPIRHWFPDAASTGTVAQLLGHAAGCVAHVEFFRELSVGDHPDPYNELISRAAAEPAHPPGIASLYSDLGYLLLGAILERVADAPLDQAFRNLIAEPLGLGGACYPGRRPLLDAVSTERDTRGLVTGVVHDENAYYGGGICGHAGLFATIGEVAAFAQAIVESVAGQPRGRLRPDVVRHFITTSAAPDSSWRLGWDTPSSTPGVSHAGDRWPRSGAIGHTGFTGTSLWLDLPRRRWVALLTNRVHPTRHGTADAIKSLRRGINDAVVLLLG